MGRLSVLEAIVIDAEQAVKGITIAAGYSVDMRQVERFRTSPFEAPFPAASIYTLAEEPEPDGTIGFEERWADLVVEGWLQASRNVEDLDKELILFQWDIYTAIVADITRGGYAIDTQFGAVRRGLAIPPNVGSVQVHFPVHYRFPIGNPWVG